MDSIDALNLLLEQLPIVAKFRSVEKVKSVVPDLVKEAQKLKDIDTQKSNQLVDSLNKVYKLTPEDVEYIPLSIEEPVRIILEISNELQARAAKIANSYLKIEGVKKSSAYLKAREKYFSYTQIDKVEGDIQYYPFYDPKLHEKMKHGAHKGKFHARLTDNLRIIYSISWWNKILTFEDIITHDELDKS